MILKYICSSLKELAGSSSSARWMLAIWPLSLLLQPASLSEAPAVFQWSLLLFSVTFVLVSCTHSTHAHSAWAVAVVVSSESTAITEASRSRLVRPLLISRLHCAIAIRIGPHGVYNPS